MGNSKKITCSTEDDPGGSSEQEILTEESWRKAYRNSVKNIEALSRYIAFAPKEKVFLKQVGKLYHMRIPQYYFSLIEKISDPFDPIRRQCIPSLNEVCDQSYENIDPLGEEKTSPLSCLVHRYPDRVLLLVTGCCFMYCRHCTRKRLWKNKTPEPGINEIEKALAYIRGNLGIREVIVSGGDPLTLPTERLDYILSALQKMHHVEVIRIGTRAPVVLPERVNEHLCDSLKRHSKIWINVQFNHPREITAESAEACRKIQQCGIPMNNQSVLLKGINDDAKVMTELCHKLQSIRVRPYYLFQCDPVVGAHHFRTSVFKGVEIIEKMRGHTSGMCVPVFVVDGVDGKGKIPLNPEYVISVSSKGLTMRNYKHETFFYHNPTD
ncbi:MAG: KamA family radical SAM protein [bacterium]